MDNTSKNRALVAYQRALEKMERAKLATDNARRCLSLYEEEEKEAEKAAREAEKKWRSSG